MLDQFGRKIEYLRISVTQKCNLRCLYCRPRDGRESPECINSLTPDEYGIIVKAMAGLGISKVRFTGGEPLMRGDICEIISRVSKIDGINDISLTTNGIRLSQMAEELKKAGLQRINISLDSLKKERFEYITGGGKLEDVKKGIQKALNAGFKPVKINTVTIKGMNDDEIDDFISLARDVPLEVRFIELMPIGDFGENNTDRIVYNSDIINERKQLRYCEDTLEGSPARYYSIEGFKGKIGFISPMSHKFCNSCNRIRLTCDGKLKPCLGNNGEADLTDVLRNQPEKLSEFIQKIIYEKPAGHHFESGFSSARNMSGIGG
jgi:cyclic pyranopterin phosphate synthase